MVNSSVKLILSFSHACSQQNDPTVLLVGHFCSASRQTMRMDARIPRAPSESVRFFLLLFDLSYGMKRSGRKHEPQASTAFFWVGDLGLHHCIKTIG